MRNGIEVYCGMGKGKTSLAVSRGLQASVQGKSVVIIQFLKGKEATQYDFLEQYNSDIKIFRFEKCEKYYEELTPQEQEEQRQNILNGFHYARKVITTQECDFLILDEFMGLLDYDIISIQDAEELLKAKDQEMEIVLTGRSMCPELAAYVDEITTLETYCPSETGIDKK